MESIQGMSKEREKEWSSPRNRMKFKNMKVRENSESLQRKRIKLRLTTDSSTTTLDTRRQG